MRVLIDIGHPGHVHLFRPFAQNMIKMGNDVLFTCRQKEFEIELLNAAGFEYISFGNHFKSKKGKILGLLIFTIKMIWTSLKFKPDLYLSHGSIYAAISAFMLGKSHLSFEDSGNMEQIRIYRPFTKVILTPEGLSEDLGKKQIRYNSYHEMAYLHPKYFSPDINKLKPLDIKSDEDFALLRFVSWNATHDVGQGGLTNEQKIELVNYLSSRMRLLISAEGDVPKEFQPYLIRIEPSDIHHVLAFARIVVSEGATMASEAGVLGTQAIYVNSLARCYNDDQEKYGTVFNFRDGTGVLEKLKVLLKESQKPKKLNSILLKDKIDLTAYLTWVVNNYPSCVETLKKNTEYQYKFK